MVMHAQEFIGVQTEYDLTQNTSKIQNNSDLKQNLGNIVSSGDQLRDNESTSDLLIKGRDDQHRDARFLKAANDTEQYRRSRDKYSAEKDGSFLSTLFSWIRAMGTLPAESWKKLWNLLYERQRRTKGLELESFRDLTKNKTAFSYDDKTHVFKRDVHTVIKGKYR